MEANQVCEWHMPLKHIMLFKRAHDYFEKMEADSYLKKWIDYDIGNDQKFKTDYLSKSCYGVKISDTKFAEIFRDNISI